MADELYDQYEDMSPLVLRLSFTHPAAPWPNRQFRQHAVRDVIRAQLSPLTDTHGLFAALVFTAVMRLPYVASATAQ